MRLLLARHARTASNVAALLDTAPPGPDLDDYGVAQAVGLGERLAGERLDAVYSSDLLRAVQTAEAVAGRLGLPTRQLPGLREIGAGDDEMSADLARYVAVLRSWGTGDPAARIPGGESGLEFVARFDAAVREAVADGHSTALLVSHGAAIRSWSGYVMPPLRELMIRRGLPNTAVITAEGDPDAGWLLVGVDFPEADPDDGFTVVDGVVAD